MNVTDRLRTTIIGCGAIAEVQHLPACAKVDAIEVTSLVEPNQQRAKELAERFAVPTVIDDYRKLPDDTQLAIVALPPSLHAPVTIDLLSRGVHVLVEKPMAITTEDCDRMIAAARQSGAMLAVGLTRRFRWGYRLVKAILDQGVLGAIASFEVREGGVFNWPTASPFFLKRESAGGGVLMDAGVHALDALLWWFGDVQAIDYADDAFGGVEADCELQLMLGGVAGRIELSRTRAMPNTLVIRGEHGSLTVPAFSNDITLTLNEPGRGKAFELAGQLAETVDGEPRFRREESAARDQLLDIVGAIRNGRPPLVSGEEGRRSVAAVEACYAQRRPLKLPWVFEGIETSTIDAQVEVEKRVKAADISTCGAGRGGGA